MSLYTVTEIENKIKAVDVQIETASKSSEYELDTGQGNQRVRRQKLSDLLRLRDYWVQQLSQLTNAEVGLLYGEIHR